MDKKTRAAVKKSIDTLIAALGPGDRMLISAMNDMNVYAERSGDGKDLRIVRESKDGFAVIRHEAF